MGWRMSRRPVETCEVPASGGDATCCSMQKFHLVRTSFSRNEDWLGWRDLRHLRRVEMSQRCHMIDAFHV